MYKDSVNLAHRSGKGESDITARFNDAHLAMEAGDKIDMSNFAAVDKIVVPAVPAVPVRRGWG